MWFLVKGLFKSVLGNQASLWVFGALFVWGLTAAYNWKQDYDGKITARANAVHTQAELERATQARDIYMKEYDQVRDNQKKDEKAIKVLQQYSDTQQALINEALNQLAKAGGDAWANTLPPSNRQRVLALTLQEIESAADIPPKCEGTPTGCIIERLRNSIYERPEGTTTPR